MVLAATTLSAPNYLYILETVSQYRIEQLVSPVYYSTFLVGLSDSSILIYSGAERLAYDPNHAICMKIYTNDKPIHSTEMGKYNDDYYVSAEILVNSKLIFRYSYIMDFIRQQMWMSTAKS